MISVDVLKRIFELNRNTIDINVEGISHEESLRSVSGANSLNWVLGHLLLSRNRIFKVLNHPPFWTGDLAQLYERGSANIHASQAIQMNEILELLAQSQVLLFNALDSLTTEDPEQLKKAAFFAFHESYHVGQTGMLSKLLGKEGAIK